MKNRPGRKARGNCDVQREEEREGEEAVTDIDALLTERSDGKFALIILSFLYGYAAVLFLVFGGDIPLWTFASLAISNILAILLAVTCIIDRLQSLKDNHVARSNGIGV